MVELGVGKNMVRSIRFWAEMSGVISQTAPSEFEVTRFGSTIFGSSTEGLDPYLEDAQTLWLIHWQFATRRENPLLGWHQMFGHWHQSEISLSSMIYASRRMMEKTENKISESSLKGHFSAFLHTYYSDKTSSRSPNEDSLDSPLVELGLLEYRCHRKCMQGRSEAVYGFRRGAKPEISDALFRYALIDFWRNEAPDEMTLSFQQIAFTPGGPGQVFQLEEREIRERLERMQWSESLSYSHSSLVQSLCRTAELSDNLLDLALEGVYR